MKITTLCLLLSAGMTVSFRPSTVKAHTCFIAPDGKDSNAGTEANPFLSFQKAFDEMSGGDTLIIKDGNYDQRYVASDRTLEEEIVSYYGIGIPDGSAEAYTVIKAENDWGVTVADGLKLSPVQYLHIQGIHFREGGSISGADHIKIIRCSFRGTVCEDNTSVVSAGTGSSYILFEECFVYGCGRYKFLAYGDQNVATEKIIFRRCVSRHDYHEPDPGWGRQCATFTSYDCHDFMMQNCISINSGDDNPALYGNLYGGIWFENKETTPKDNSANIQGCIFLDLSGLAAINDPKNNGNRIIEHCVVWDTKGGYGGGVISGNPILTLNHLTIGNIFGEFQDMSYAWGTAVYCSEGFAEQRFVNSAVVNCQSYGIADYVNSDYNIYFGEQSQTFGNTWETPTPKNGDNDRFEDPQLKYLCRIEEGSPAKGTASDGGDRGATILHRYGRSGTLWGEPGYDSLTSEPLWPFPNESVIKAVMSSWEGQNDAKRGFCASGTGRYGGPITLTSYIWEYLGESCPSEICSGAGAVERNAVNFGDRLLKIELILNRRTSVLSVKAALDGVLTVTLYDALGKEVAVVKHGYITGGRHFVAVSAGDDGFSKGIYFLKVKLRDEIQTVKLALVR